MGNTKHKAEPIIILALFVIYLIVLFKITIFRDSNSGVRSVNLIPFITISEYFQSVLSGNKIIGISNILGNLILFFPLGYISALLFPKMRKLTRILILAFVFSLFIEVFQYIFARGSTDIDDVILNILGGAVGYWVYVLISRFLEPKKYAIFISTLMIAFTCTGFFVGNNYENLIQGDVKEISNDSIVVSRIYLDRSKEESTSSTTRSNERFEVAFSENCKITLVEMQQNGKIIGEKTISKDDIRLNDLILLKTFLLTENDIYMAEDAEVHRVE